MQNTNYLIKTVHVYTRQRGEKVAKQADDTTVVGLITDNEKTAYREEVRDLAVWCQDNNLFLKWPPGLSTVTPQPHIIFTLQQLPVYYLCIVTLPLPTCTNYLD